MQNEFHMFLEFQRNIWIGQYYSIILRALARLIHLPEILYSVCLKWFVSLAQYVSQVLFLDLARSWNPQTGLHKCCTARAIGCYNKRQIDVMEEP